MCSYYDFDRVWAIFSIFGIMAFVIKSRLDMVFRYVYDFSSIWIVASHVWLIFISCRSTSIHNIEFWRDWTKKRESGDGRYETITCYVWILSTTLFCKKTTKIENFAFLQDSQKSANNCVMCTYKRSWSDCWIFCGNFSIFWNVAFLVNTRLYITFCDQIT